MASSDLDRAYTQDFIPFAHRLGIATLLLGLGMTLLPGFYLSFVLGAWPGIDAVMRVEPLVFIGDQHPHEIGIDIAQTGLQPPPAFIIGEDAQGFAIAVDQFDGELPALFQWRRVRSVEPVEREHRDSQDDSRPEQRKPDTPS